MPFSRGSSQPRNQTQVSHIAGGFFTVWATREASKCYFYDVVPSYPWRAHCKIRSGCLKPQIVPHPVHTLLCPSPMGGSEVQGGKQWLLIQVGQSRAGWDFIMQLGTSCNLRFMNYFWNFPFHMFGLLLTSGDLRYPRLCKLKLSIRRTSVYLVLKFSGTLINVAECLCILREKYDLFPGGGHGTPLQYSCLENPMDRGPWQVIVHAVTEIWTRLKQLSMQAWSLYIYLAHKPQIFNCTFHVKSRNNVTTLEFSPFTSKAHACTWI